MFLISSLRTRAAFASLTVAAEERLAVQLARDQLEVQVDEGHQLAHLGGGERVGRQQRRLADSALSMYSTMAWLSHSGPCSVRMNGILASGDAASTRLVLVRRS